jgi:hypothetical protein
MNGNTIASRAGLFVALAATLAGVFAAGVARNLAPPPAAAVSPALPAAAQAPPVLPEIVVTASRLEA